MNFLIMMNEIDKKYSANNKIIFTVCEELERQGHKCFFVSISDEALTNKYIKLNNKEINVIPRNKNLAVIRKIKNDPSSINNKFLYYMTHPHHLLKMIVFKNDDYNEFLNSVYSIIQSNRIDCVLFYYFPIYYTYQVFSRIKTDCFKVLYQLDPWGYHELTPENKASIRREEELQMYNLADLIITTPVLYNLYKKDFQYSQYFNKMISLNFPNITINKENTLENEDTQNNDDVYNLYYLGTVDDKYRNPKFFLDFIQRIRTEYNILINTYFIGNIDSLTLQEYSNKYNYVNLSGSIDYKETQKIINSKGNILVNINNSIHYQMPSKVIDYISSRNPIINVIKNKDDFTVELLDDYPLSFNIYEYKDNNIDDFVQFLKNSKNKKVDLEIIEHKYNNLTPQFFVNELIKNINNTKQH